MIYPCTVKDSQGNIKEVFTTAELVARSDAEFQKGGRKQYKAKIKLECPMCGDTVTRQLKSNKTCTKQACVEEYEPIEAERQAKRKGKR